MVLDAFAKVVSQADTRGEYLTDAQLDALSELVKDGNKRAEQPQLITPGGNAYTSRRAAACIRDLDIILRYITYAIFAGDSSVLDDRALNGLRETYLALGTPGASVAVGIQKLKAASLAIVNDTNNITRGDCSALASEIAGYFDRAASAVA